jgi:OMF family outer membrane factor
MEEIKKICRIKLVSIHIPKHFILLLIGIFSFQLVKAQELNLEQCLDSVKVHNRQLQMSRNQVLIGHEKEREANANRIPKVQLTADYKYFTELPTQLMPMTAFGGPEGQFKETQFGVPHNINTSIQVSMPLYNPQIYGAMKTSHIAVELAELQAQKTEEQVLFESTHLFYNAQILFHQMAFIDSNLNNTKQLHSQLKLLHGQQMVKASDVDKVALQVAQLETQLQSVNTSYHQVLNSLKFYMGIPVNQPLSIKSDIQFNIAENQSSGVAVDIPIAAMHQKLVGSEMQALKKSRLPSVSLYASYGQNGLGYDEKPNDFLKFFPSSFAGVQVSVPLFNGMVTKRKIDQKKIEFKNSELQLEMVSQQTELQVENFLRQKLNSQRAISDTEAQIILAQNIYKNTVLQQQEGTASLSDVLMADNSLREAQQAYLSAVISYLKADLELKKVNGSLVETHK